MALEIWLPRLLFALGITNILGIFLVLLTCRCLAGFTLKNKFLEKLYNHHCYFWKFFLVSVAVHAIIGLYVVGIPN